MVGEGEVSATLTVTAAGFPENVSVETYVLLYTNDGSALGKPTTTFPHDIGER